MLPEILFGEVCRTVGFVKRFVSLDKKAMSLHSLLGIKFAIPSGSIHSAYEVTESCSFYINGK